MVRLLFVSLAYLKLQALKQLILNLLVFLFVSFSTYSQLYTFRSFDHKDGLVLSSVLSSAEDKDGFIWFGTDGAGLIRFDGKYFDNLANFQGRTSRHISNISFSKDNILYFSTEYQGFYTSNWKTAIELDYVPKMGRGQAIIHLQGYVVIIEDAALFLLKDEKLLDEKRIYPFNVAMHYYGHQEVDERLFIFTSRGNFVVHDGKIEYLHDWLGTSEKITNDLVSLSFYGDSLTLTNKTLTEELTIILDNFRPKFFIRDNIQDTIQLKANEKVVKSAFSKKFSVFVTNEGRLIKRDGKTGILDEIINNSGRDIINPTSLLIDRNEDIWVTTKLSGIFRVSLEPFTALKFDPIYENDKIFFIGKSKQNDVFLSSNDRSYLGNLSLNYGFDEYPFQIKGSAQIDGVTYLATNKGLKEVDNLKIQASSYSKLNSLSLTFIFYSQNENKLYLGEESAGLFSLDLKTGEIFFFDESPAYIYTAQELALSGELLFGTNNGVYKLSDSKLGLIQLSSMIDSIDLGSYSGNSTVDSFGNLWFSLDFGLLCYTTKGALKGVHKENHLPSTLIYTLASDNSGNLLIGTNRGITVLNVNKDGDPISSLTYNKENGFMGYETHMRSCYKDDRGNIFVGTLEGVFMIRSNLLMTNTPPPPPFVLGIQNKLGGPMLDIKDDNVFNDGENNVSILFRSINTKNDFVKYSFRLIGWDEEWSEWKSEGVAMFSNLPSGNYSFEARATIDGVNISDIRIYEFTVKIPFYKSKLFILFGIGLIIVLNIFLLEKTKNFSRKNIIHFKDTATDYRGIAAILLFGAVANTGAHLFASRIDSTIENHDVSAIVAGGIVFTLFLLVVFMNFFKAKASTLLTIGFIVIILQNFIGVYYSNLHPFFLMAIILTCFVSPIVFRSFKSAMAFAFIMIAVAFGIVFNLKDTQYNQFLFIVGIFIAAFLTVFLTYIRNNSLEKLIFTSGVVNKGNVLVIAFDRNGKISYNSENITRLIDINGGDLKGVYVSDLNKYQPKFETENKFANVDLKNEFREGKIFVTPLVTKIGEVVYYQWSCKEFSEDVRVILGQDVTDKINLENYYELIVHNADDLIFQTDPYAKLTFINNKCIETFKYKEEEILGKPTTFIVHPDYKDIVQEFYNKQFVERKRTTYFEFPIIDGEGNERWLGQNVTTLFKPGADNIITGFLGLARDITEKRKANALIKEQNKDITASINYARRIQFNMLPRATDFDQFFDEHFVLFRPKDIVSGDFYWIGEVDNKVIVICSDCTGHGVPGSFMTLLGINFLNQIILEAKITDVAEILNELDNRLVEVLPRDGRNKIKDGMEVVAFVFHKDDTRVQFASAGGRFAVTSEDNDELFIHKGDHKHIGDVLDDDPDFKYSAQDLSIERNQTVYLFSDGYPDQFGGSRNKKLTVKKYLALLDTITHQSLTEQNYILTDHLNEWIGEYPQTDDITVIGIRGVK